jgi:integrase
MGVLFMKPEKQNTSIEKYKNTWKNYYEEDIKYLKENEIRDFLNGITNEFHKMLFLFLFETGARISEILNVRLFDVNFENNTVKLITLKRRTNNITRVLSISNSLINKILIYEKKKKLSNSDFIFAKRPRNSAISIQAVNKAMKIYFLNIFGEHYISLAHPHTLRHSRAIQLLNSGVNIMHVKTILGHSNIMNTLIYLKYSSKDLHDSIKKSNSLIGLN